MNIPDDRRYTDQHEWVLLEDGTARIGITDYAQDALGDVVFVDLPEAGATVAAGDTIAEVESTEVDDVVDGDARMAADTPPAGASEMSAAVADGDEEE